MTDKPPVLATQTYTSSRWTSGNFWFPDHVELAGEGVLFRKRRLIGGDLESIRYEQISSVTVEKRLFFADLLLETTGGSEPVYINGLWISHANRAKRELDLRLKHKEVSHDERVIALLERQTALLEQIAQAQRTSND